MTTRLLNRSYNLADSLAKNFLQDVFLAANLSSPGSFSLLISEFASFGGDYRVSLDKLDAYHFEAAKRTASLQDWPPVSDIALEKVWDWLRRIGFLGKQIAVSPAQKLAACLLNLGASDFLPTPLDPLLWVIQVLESLFVKTHDGISRQLRERIEKVLGSPSCRQKWLNELYNERSRLAHGNSPILRLGATETLEYDVNFIWMESLEKLSIGYAVILSVAQNLILNDSCGYRFTEDFERLPL